MMKRFSLTASSHLAAMASCTASSAYCERGLRCSLVSAFKTGRAPMAGRGIRKRNAEYTVNLRPRLAIAGAVALLLATACATSAPAAPAPPTLRIGVDLPITGREARAAVPALNGIRFFVQTHPTLDGFNVA